MKIPKSEWDSYVDKLSKINQKASDSIKKYVETYGLEDVNGLIDYSYMVANTYGNASASLNALMYDAISELEGKILPDAEPAELPSYSEVAKTINGTLKISQNVNEISGAVSRLVKRTGQDTLLKNGIRDGAEFAWIPSGDTCAFCLTLASRGWQRISKKSLKNGHAEHIHSNCDCSYMIRHSDDIDVAGYDPDRYLQMYNSAEGKTPNEKINSMRRMQYAERKDVINAQKRAAYANRKKEVFEKERLLRRYNNSVNLGALDAPGYVDKFNAISDIDAVNNSIYESACEILKHRNGTDYEDIHFINAATGDFIHRLTTCNIPNGVEYDEATKLAIADAHDKGIKIIAIHNHPGGLPPTLDDGVSAHDNDYIMGVAVGHNFEVYTYNRTDAHYSKEQCKNVHKSINEIVGLEIEFDDSIWYNALNKFGMEVIRR